MIGRLSGRQRFERIARRGERIAVFPLWCNWCPSNDGPNLGFALTRAIGSAPARNLARRRLRSIVRTYHRDHGLPPIDLLIGAQPKISELTFEQLVATTEALLAKISLHQTEPSV